MGRFDVGFSAVALVNITFKVEAYAFAQENEVVDIESFTEIDLRLDSVLVSQFNMH